MVAALLFLTLNVPSAQEEKPQDPPVESAIRIYLSGRLELDYVFRDRVINETSLWTPGGLASGSLHRRNDDFISPLVTVRLDAEMTTHVSAVVEIGNQRINFDSFSPLLQNERAGDDGMAVIVRQAYVKVDGWPLEELSGSFGFMEFMHDPSGWGRPIFLSSHAESPWDELPDSTLPPFPAFSTNTVPQTRRDELQPTGFHAQYTGEKLSVILWAFPAMIERGTTSADEALYGAVGSYDFDIGEGTLTVGLVTALLIGGTDLVGFGPGDQLIFTIGGTLRFEMGILDAFVEAYKQFGDAGNVDTSGDGLPEDLDAEGFAFRIGARVRLDLPWKPWASAELLWVSGDKSALDDEEGRFLSYENNDATPIVEGNEFGLDVDNNYWVIRFTIGASFQPAETFPSIDVQTALSFFRLIESVPLPPDPPFAVSGTDDHLGVEWDLLVRATISTQVWLEGGFSALLSSGVLEEFTKGRKSRALLGTFGTRLRF